MKRESSEGVQSVKPYVCLCQGFMDLNITEFQKLAPNVTGFQLVNRSDPAVERINQDWLDFDSKDLKLARRRLRVQTHSHTYSFIYAVIV